MLADLEDRHVKRIIQQSVRGGRRAELGLQPIPVCVSDCMCIIRYVPREVHDAHQREEKKRRREIHKRGPRGRAGRCGDKGDR